MIGIIFTLVCSFFAAFYFITNDIFKIRGDVFVFWRSVFAALILIPFAPFLSWDGGLVAYTFVAIANILYSFGDIYLFNATHKYSASAITRILVCRNIILFCLWPLIYADYGLRLASNHVVLLGSFSLILISTLALYKMRKSPMGREIILAALPALLFLSSAELFTGIAVKGKMTLDFALSAGIVASVTMSFISAAILFYKSKCGDVIALYDGPWRRAATINAVLFIGVIITKSVGIAALENPGYFGAMVTIYTLWIYLLHRYWLKRTELADPRLGFVVVACSIGLAILSLQIPK
jgi:hypothetical protein